MSDIYTAENPYNGPWPWPHFTPGEIACRHCGELRLDPGPGSPSRSLDALERLRALWGRPIIINSAHRCPLHNQKVGGAKNSRHLSLAFDCACPAPLQAEFVRLARRAGFTGIGLYPRKNFVHLDLGPARRWQE